MQSMAQFVNEGLAVKEERGLPDHQRIEDEQFHEELKFLCVKFSSLSRAQEIINDLSGYLLQRIQALAAKHNPTSTSPRASRFGFKLGNDLNAPSSDAKKL